MQKTQSLKGLKQELIITRIFDAPSELVWKAWTEEEQLQRWWGPKAFTAPVIKNDLRVGGKYLYSMKSPEGRGFWNTGIFREIVPLKRLVLTDSFADEKGNVVPASYYGMDPNFPLESVLTITFEEDDDKTKLTITNNDTSGISEKVLQDARQGWNEMLDKLAQHLKRG